MMKKISMIWLACLVVFAFSAPALVEAKPRGTYKSPRSSYTTPTKPSGENVNKAETGKTAPKPGVNSTPNRGFFSGGGFLRGLMIGGLAGMLFGGLFGGMGFLGNLLGLAVNLLALYVLFILIRKIVLFFIDRRKHQRKRFE